jgi:hypothetical protein
MKNEEELTYGERAKLNEELLDNVDRSERHNINIANRPPRSIDPMSPRNLDHATTREVLAERGERYGDFKDHAKLCQDLKTVMRTGKSWNDCSDTHKQALEVIADKIARMLNGDPNYEDNVVDIIGYSQLVLDQLRKD